MEKSRLNCVTLHTTEVNQKTAAVLLTHLTFCSEHTPPRVAPAAGSRTTLLRNQRTSALTYHINTSANPGDLLLTGKVPSENVWRAMMTVCRCNKPAAFQLVLLHGGWKKSRCPTPTPLKYNSSVGKDQVIETKRARNTLNNQKAKHLQPSKHQGGWIHPVECTAVPCAANCHLVYLGPLHYCRGV